MFGEKINYKNIIMQVVVVGKPDNDKIDEFLYRIQEEMLKFALENDGINSISFKISDITKLHELRHSYLHLSDSPDDNFVNQANYEKEDGSFKKRDVLKG